MAVITNEFTTYVVYYISGSSPSVGLPQDAEIDCFNAAGDRAGIIYFFPNNKALPVNQNTVNGIYLYYKMSRFADVMTMLKEESPLYLYFDTVAKYAYIGTQNEPIGERET